ncbi:unnamed protein product [Caenorhabditis angaria]|uniref:Uncharacterized protein n=1 Tax=Caenorhabditis angaria TaxID=860376 RepID=A0A9P1MYW7_9PELO|nr:unnamed protein product [Caenorhabditis angaria]
MQNSLVFGLVSLVAFLMAEQNYGQQLYQYQSKFSPLQYKRHISPSYDVEVGAGNMKNLFSIGKRQLSPAYDMAVNAGNMRTLLDVGKRQVSVANEIGDQIQMYNRLFDAGKKRSAISPAYNFQSSMGLSDALEQAGRR